MVGRPYEYPNADARSPRDPKHFCEKEKILGLYNQEHGTKRVRMSPEVEAWFEAEGRKRKWVGFHFSAAGCMMIAYVIHAEDAADAPANASSDKVVHLDTAARHRKR